MHIPAIPPIDEAARQQALDRQSLLTKPTGALGRLEALSVDLAGMTGRLDWLPVHRSIVICAGDHGVTTQGISAYPRSVTAQMVLNFLHGGAAINVLARQMGARVTVVDAGVAAVFEPHPALIQAKIASGTADISVGPAMSIAQSEAAVHLGLRVMEIEMQRSIDLLVVGEMGIGNTTAASAVIAAITGQSVAEVTGRGTGLDDAALAHKIAVVEKALAVNRPSPSEALQKVGGFEIGAMVGLILGAAAARVPVLIDGLISTSAALVAAQLMPAVRAYLIAGHRSAEPGHIIALESLGLFPLLDLGLRLGEGTGAALAIPLLEAAMRTLNEMATFGDAGVSGPR